MMDISKRNQRAKLRKQHEKIGANQKRILVLLFGGLALACAHSSKQQWKIIKGTYESLKEIQKQAAERALEALYESHLIDARESPDGTYAITLSEKGRERVLTYRLAYMKVKPAPWDGKWRIALYDVPEDEREARNAFRNHLKRLGFRKLQHSAGIIPFPCKDELEFVVELLDIRKYVRYIEAVHIDNESYWKQIFKLDV